MIMRWRYPVISALLRWYETPAKRRAVQFGLFVVLLLPVFILAWFSYGWIGSEKAVAVETFFAAVLFANMLIGAVISGLLAMADHRRRRERAILDLIPVGVFVARAPDGQPLLANKRGVQLLGRQVDTKSSAEEYSDTYSLRRADGSLYPTDALPLTITLRTGKPAKKDDIVVHRPDGARITLRAESAPIVDSRGRMTAAAAVFEDRSLETELERKKSEFISIASHELRTPLSAVKWSVESLLSGEVGPLTEEQRGMLHDVFEAGARMNDLVNDLLSVSRLESGKIDANPAPLDTVAAIEEVVDSVMPLISKNRQSITVKAANLPRVFADAKLLKQVLSNVLSNAMKYTPDGGAIRVVAKPVGNMVAISVSDTGMGIPPEEKERIFDRFFRASNVASTSISGTGLGLYVSRVIVRQFGGDMTFTSELGTGTTFTFTLPIAEKTS